MENRFGYLSLEISYWTVWTASKDVVKKAKTTPFVCITLFVTYLCRHCMTTTWVFLFFFWCFFMNAKQQKMRADAKGATREAKRGARVTFLDRGWRFHALSESRDYSTSTLASHADFRYCHYNDSSFTILKEISYIKYTLYYVADVRLLVTLSSLSWGRNTWRNLRTKNVCAGSYSLSKYLKGSRKWNLDSFMIKISPIQTFFSNFLK